MLLPTTKDPLMLDVASHITLTPRPDAGTDRWVRQNWMDRAACKGQPHLFFPPLAERPQARARREAKAATVCESCPVLDPCRLFARVNREYGFWGGESEEQRGDAGFPVPSPIGGRARKRRLAAEAAAAEDDTAGESLAS